MRPHRRRSRRVPKGTSARCYTLKFPGDREFAVKNGNLLYFSAFCPNLREIQRHLSASGFRSTLATGRGLLTLRGHHSGLRGSIGGGSPTVHLIRKNQLTAARSSGVRGPVATDARRQQKHAQVLMFQPSGRRRMWVVLAFPDFDRGLAGRISLQGTKIGR